MIVMSVRRNWYGKRVWEEMPELTDYLTFVYGEDFVKSVFDSSEEKEEQ